jgi:polar amino acid transport system substrate-binding protein
VIAGLLILSPCGIAPAGGWAQGEGDSFPDSEQSPPSDGYWDLLQKRGLMRVGIDPSLGKAYLYADEATHSYQGFEWDILQAIVAQLKIDLEPVYIPWSEQLQALQQGKVDLILGAREAAGLDPAQFLPTAAYYLSPQRLLIRADQAQPIEHLSQLFGKKVGIVVNSTGAALLETYNRSRGNSIRLFATSNPDRLFAQLRAGQLDAVLIDQPVANVAMAEAEQSLVISGSPLFPMPLVGVVSADHPSLKQALDQAIGTLKTNGELKQILEDWQLWDSAVMPLASKKD